MTVDLNHSRQITSLDTSDDKKSDGNVDDVDYHDVDDDDDDDHVDDGVSRFSELYAVMHAISGYQM